MTKCTRIILAGTDSVLDTALAASLQCLRPDWQVVSRCNGRDILQHSLEDNTDCVITDIALADMSGGDLLGKLQSQSPETVRLILTHDLDQEIIMESARASHRFINRAVADDVLVSTIESSLRLRDVLADVSLRRAMSEVQNLPSLPDIYMQMVDELVLPQSSLQKVGTIIEADVGLTATVLKMVNSAFYGLNQRVESVAQAVALLGVHLIKNITLTAKVFMQFDASEVGIKRLQRLNDDANRVGAMCNHFARLARVQRSVVDHTQIAGMLSNVGDLVELLKPPADRPQNVDLMGAQLLRHWLLPDPVVEAIALQNEPINQVTNNVTPLLVLHCIRYMEKHLPDASVASSKQDCLDYLQAIMDPVLAERWLESYSDLQLLNLRNDHTGKVKAA